MNRRVWARAPHFSGRRVWSKEEEAVMSEDKKSAKQEALRQVVQGLEKTYGQGTIMQLGSGAPEPIAVIPSGALVLDEALGVGGYPRGRVVEIFGPESSGKTTLTLHAIAEAQKAGGTAAFIDAEHAFDLRYARGIGIDLKKLLMSQPDCGEQALEIAEALTRSGAVDLVVIDSVAALVPKAEIEGDMGDAHMGLQARLMSQALRKLTAIAHKTGTTLIFINQLRMKIGVVFGNPETTTGGNALKFYASVRLDVRRIGKVTLGENVVGNRTRVKVVKNKVAPPFTEAEFDIRWGTGIDTGADLVEVAAQAGVLEKNGSHYLFGGKSIGQGRDKTRDALLLDPALFQAVRKQTLEVLPSQAFRLDKKRAA
jgi:recombination protein RecA